MKWNESITSTCRYGEVAEAIWKDWNIVWEDSYSNYQGSVKFLAEKDGKYCYYEWDYGSCSGCDAWESMGYNDDRIAEEMKLTAFWIDSKEQLESWLDNIKKNITNSSLTSIQQAFEGRRNMMESLYDQGLIKC